MWKLSSLIGVALVVAIAWLSGSVVSAAPAGAATGLRVSSEGCVGSQAQARLTWTPPGKGEQQIQLSSLNNGFASGFSVRTVDRSTSALMLTSLKPGTLYYVRVATLTSGGTLNSDTATFTATCAVAAITAPKHLQSAAISNQVRFAWTPGQNNTWFCVDTARSLADLQSMKGTWRNHCRTAASSLTVSDLRCGATYYWLVYAWSGPANIKSSPATVKTPACVIGQPTNLSFKQTDDDSVRLSWTAGKNNRWFCVDVAQSSQDLKNRTGTWKNFGCWQTTTTLNLTDIKCGTVYHFNVYAWNEDVNTRSADSTFELVECEALVLAQIDDLFVEPTEDDPARYILTAVTILPNDCYEHDGYKITRKDRTITIQVLNLLEKDGKCSGKATTQDVEIDLGTKFESGVRYTVQVNDERIRFTAE